MTPQEYAAALLTEEMGEALLELGKAGRFGLDTPGPINTTYMGQTARARLEKEIGDVTAAISYAIQAGLINGDAVDDYAGAKLDKLLDPESRDAQGNRLAPEVQLFPDPLGAAAREDFVDAFFQFDAEPVRALHEENDTMEWRWYQEARAHADDGPINPPPAPDIIGFHGAKDGRWQAASAKEPERSDPQPDLRGYPVRWMNNEGKVWEATHWRLVYDEEVKPAPSPAEPPTLDQLRAEIGVMYTYIADARDEVAGAERAFDRIATMLREME